MPLLIGRSATNFIKVRIISSYDWETGIYENNALMADFQNFTLVALNIFGRLFQVDFIYLPFPLEYRKFFTLDYKKGELY